MTLVITLKDILFILLGLFVLGIIIFCKVCDWQNSRKSGKLATPDSIKPTDKEKFSACLKECGIEHIVVSAGIELEDAALEGDGYLFIKFYEDGKFQEFIHYPG